MFGGPAEVDPGTAVAFELVGLDRRPRRRFGRGDGKADQAVDFVAHFANRPARVGLDQGVGGAGADRVHHFFAAEDPALAMV